MKEVIEFKLEELREQVTSLHTKFDEFVKESREIRDEFRNSLANQKLEIVKNSVLLENHIKNHNGNKRILIASGGIGGFVGGLLSFLKDYFK